MAKKYVDDTMVGLVGTASTTNAGTVEMATDAELQAGTATGSVGPLAAYGSSFTETPTASKVCVANDSGQLADGWLGLTTAGDLPYSDGTDFGRVAIGGANTYLTTNGTNFRIHE